jgi:hypothetical protein
MGAEWEGWDGMEAHSNVECRVEFMQVMEEGKRRKLELKLWRIATLT